jgi:hypothetical protein
VKEELGDAPEMTFMQASRLPCKRKFSVLAIFSNLRIHRWYNFPNSCRKFHKMMLTRSFEIEKPAVRLKRELYLNEKNRFDVGGGEPRSNGRVWSECG